MITPLIAPNGVTFINVFTVDPSRQTLLADRVKQDADTLISQQAGFIKAIVHRSIDGAKVVNVVQWESLEASRAIHRNPDIAAGFASYSELGVQMDLRYYETATSCDQRVTLNPDRVMADIDVWSVTPDQQLSLLKQLMLDATPAIAPQIGAPSVVWFRSLDGIRLIRLSYFQESAHSEKTTSNRRRGATAETWMEQVQSHRYWVEAVITTEGVLA